MDDDSPMHMKNKDSAQSYQTKLLQNYRIHLIQSWKFEYYLKTWRKWTFHLMMKKKILDDDEEGSEMLSAYTRCSMMVKKGVKCSMHTQEAENLFFEMLWKHTVFNSTNFLYKNWYTPLWAEDGSCGEKTHHNVSQATEDRGKKINCWRIGTPHCGKKMTMWQQEDKPWQWPNLRRPRNHHILKAKHAQKCPPFFSG